MRNLSPNNRLESIELRDESAMTQVSEPLPSLALNSAGLSVLINVAALAPVITIIQGLSSWRMGEQIRDKLLTSHDDFIAYFRRTL